MERYDAVIVGAGAAGLFCAGVAGQLGLKVLLLDHAPKVGEKIRISGGGRCNFTNLHTSAAQFLSANPGFCRSALARYRPTDFVALLQRHGIPFHEKHKGQLFCSHSATDIVNLLLAECDAGGVTRWQPCALKNVRFLASSPYSDWNHCYEIHSDRGALHARALVVATGGLSIPAMGASDLGYRLAGQFDIPLIPPRPALVPLCFDAADWAPFATLSGLSLPVRISTPACRAGFDEDLLLTHRGLSGPAALQISSYWQPGSPLHINLTPDEDLADELRTVKAHARRRLAHELATHLPGRLADLWIARGVAAGQPWDRPTNEVPDRALVALAQQLANWSPVPNGTEGYRKAEVTAGGVDTRALSSRTMESTQPGLYFIGEVVDVTGWLGGYNFQWAWSSGYACAQALASRHATAPATRDRQTP